jgi:hypothetical protein
MKKNHNMFSLMLNLRLKKFHFIYLFFVIEPYDKKFL